jgi:hypothetical protein
MTEGKNRQMSQSNEPAPTAQTRGVEPAEASVVEPEGVSAGNALGRGQFLKWGTVALSGMYVGPKITSFAVEKSLGHGGSVTPAPVPVPVPSPPVEFFPATGGAAGLTPEQRKELERRGR